MSKKEIPYAFCTAPWVHAHVAANGKRRLCCIAEEAPEQYSKLPWNEFKNSEYMKNVRKQMLENKVPPECKICENPNRVETMRDKWISMYPGESAAAVESTAPDGSTDFKIKYLDYRSNLCNLKCRTCDPSASSSFHTLVSKNFNTDLKAMFGDIGETSPMPTVKNYESIYSKEAMQFCETEDLTRIYFAGGEPFVESSHLPLLQKLVDQKKASNVILAYNTNLGYSLNTLKAWLELAVHFKEIYFFVSIDGEGDIAEYIRAGLKFKNFETNLDYLIQNKPPELRLYLDITFTSLNLFFMQEFADFAIRKNVQTTGKLMVFGENSFPLLRCESISQNVKQKLLTEWNSYFAKLTESQKNLVNVLDGTMKLFGTTTPTQFVSKNESLHRLKTFENLHPNESKFLELLSRKPLGTEWCRELTNETI
ncbi:MAG: hypothetical protein K0R29_1264 [Pseudobdellovibrio sp.]|jgi:hypothetical protein|nr:hypothetical protein [Pseudobdellovibrio sp.]